MNLLPRTSFVFILGTLWLLLGLGGYLFFQLSRNTNLKRRLFPVFVASICLVLGWLLIELVHGQFQMVMITVPVILLIFFINIRTTRFCKGCGRTVHRQPVFVPPGNCPHCGASLR